MLREVTPADLRCLAVSRRRTRKRQYALIQLHGRVRRRLTVKQERTRERDYEIFYGLLPDLMSLNFQNSTRESRNPMAISCPVLDMARP
jgi:hypothetical protein